VKDGARRPWLSVWGFWQWELCVLEFMQKVSVEGRVFQQQGHHCDLGGCDKDGRYVMKLPYFA
jgi:hypothetical protein